MGNAGSPRSWWQTLLVELYGYAVRLGWVQSGVGRCLFDSAYRAYKLALEGGAIRRLRSYVPVNGSIIDVGANIGVFTVLFARWTSGAGRVIAVEPEPMNFAALQQRLRRAGVLDRVILVQAAAAEQSGSVFLEINPVHPGDHRLAPSGVSIAAATLDQLVAEYRLRAVSLVKIDVQGAEMRVLEGAGRVLCEHRPALFIEIDEQALRKQGTSTAALLDHLRKSGYKPYRIGRWAEPLPLAVSDIGHHGYEDVLFLPDRR